MHLLLIYSGFQILPDAWCWNHPRWSITCMPVFVSIHARYFRSTACGISRADCLMPVGVTGLSLPPLPLYINP